MLRAYRIPRVEIIHANVATFGFEGYDAFYIFNPFQENIFPAECIDSDVELVPALYRIYAAYVRAQLSSAPPGSRVATYWGDDEEIPHSYECVETHFEGKLKFWCKRDDSGSFTPFEEESALAQHRDPAMGARGMPLA